jgi:excisionase family DNA binding protein
VRELTAVKPKTERQYYTVSEAAELIGDSGQTVKNWINSGMLKGYRLGGRIVIPRSILDGYRPLPDALKGLDPTPPTEEILEEIRKGRCPWLWPASDDRTLENRPLDRGLTKRPQASTDHAL